MKEFFSAVKNNLSNLFAIFGILLMVYFSVFYVPQYVEELKLKKIEAANNALMSVIQELVYNNHPIDEEDLMTLVRGKELKENIVYPYSLDELLIQTQERFLDNNFIPLEQRKALVEKIDTIRHQLTKPLEEKKEEKTKFPNIFVLIIAFTGVAASILGLLSFWAKAKFLKELELESKLEETKEELKYQVREGVKIESLVSEALKGIVNESEFKYGTQDTGVDFIVELKEGKRVGIEVKYTETGLIPVRTISELISVSHFLEIPILLISNAPLTKNASKKVEDYNKAFHKTKIDILTIKELGDIKNNLRTYINEQA